ncbi:hypothetical protein LX36DRAFT_663728 [Colletotrichum falcatum]|nr:hypothetical protein LX36DRAFT_663728 [Colletotrichum falcatum]
MPPPWLLTTEPTLRWAKLWGKERKKTRGRGRRRTISLSGWPFERLVDRCFAGQTRPNQISIGLAVIGSSDDVLARGRPHDDEGLTFPSPPATRHPPLPHPDQPNCRGREWQPDVDDRGWLLRRGVPIRGRGRKLTNAMPGGGPKHGRGMLRPEVLRKGADNDTEALRSPPRKAGF